MWDTLDVGAIIKLRSPALEPLSTAPGGVTCSRLPLIRRDRITAVALPAVPPSPESAGKSCWSPAVGRAVWSCVYQKTPAARGSGASRGREGVEDARVRFIFRNNVFRNLGAGLSSALIRAALDMTRVEWERRYGSWPEERLRTEIDIKAVPSTNPGFCYEKAGWERGELKGRKLIWWAQLSAGLAATYPTVSAPFSVVHGEPI